MHLELSTEIPGASRCLSKQEMFQSCMNNKIENSQADFSTLSTKTPDIQFCRLFLYCKLRTLRNSERKFPRHPHLLLTNQHKNADVSFIYLRSFLPEISWVRSSKLPPLLRGGDNSALCSSVAHCSPTKLGFFLATLYLRFLIKRKT